MRGLELLLARSPVVILYLWQVPKEVFFGKVQLPVIWVFFQFGDFVPDLTLGTKTENEKVSKD